jgi:hypothetical protein
VGAASVALVTIGVVSAASLLNETITTATETLESEASDAASGDTGSGETESGVADVERYTAEEMLCTFRATVELYDDGRHDNQCAVEYVEGCWQSALFTEADCNAMEIGLAFTNDLDALLPDHRETMAKQDVVADEAMVVVFGNDEYADGWIDQVTCLEAG